jgi:chromosome segregation ATPase
MVLQPYHDCMTSISLRLDDDLLESLDEEAEEIGVSRSEYIRDTLESRNEADVLQSELNELQAEYKELEAHYDDLKRQLDTAKGRLEEYSELQEEYAELKDEYEALEARHADLQRQLSAVNTRQEDVGELVEYVEEQRELTRYQERRQRLFDNATILRRWKWMLTGVPVDHEDE